MAYGVCACQSLSAAPDIILPTMVSRRTVKMVRSGEVVGSYQARAEVYKPRWPIEVCASAAARASGGMFPVILACASKTEVGWLSLTRSAPPMPIPVLTSPMVSHGVVEVG